MPRPDHPVSIAYCRTSTNRQGPSLVGQADEIRKFVKQSKSLPPLFEPPFIDGAVSGARPFLARPSGKRLISLLEPGDVIVVTDFDRFSRSLIDYLNTREAVEELGARIQLMKFGEMILRGAMGRMFENIMGTFAEFDRTFRKERCAEGTMRAKERGQRLNRHPPPGSVAIGKGRNAFSVEHPQMMRDMENMQRLRRQDWTIARIAEKYKNKKGASGRFYTYDMCKRYVRLNLPDLKKNGRVNNA